MGNGKEKEEESPAQVWVTVLSFARVEGRMLTNTMGSREEFFFFLSFFLSFFRSPFFHFLSWNHYMNIILKVQFVMVLGACYVIAKGKHDNDTISSSMST